MNFKKIGAGVLMTTMVATMGAFAQSEEIKAEPIQAIKIEQMAKVDLLNMLKIDEETNTAMESKDGGKTWTKFEGEVIPATKLTPATECKMELLTFSIKAIPATEIVEETDKIDSSKITATVASTLAEIAE